MSDPVAEKSSFLKMYMSHHPDTLVAYVKFFGKVSENVTSAEMTAIDSKSMTLSYKTRNGDKKQVVVPITPPLSGYDDVKPRLLEMKAQAQEGLGMIKTPQIKSFVFPRKVAISITIIGLALYTTFAPKDDPSPWYTPAGKILSAMGGPLALKVFWTTFGIVHTLEGVYTYTLCKKHTNFTVGAEYVIGATVLGFPIVLDLRKRIQDARIESVMKVE